MNDKDFCVVIDLRKLPPHVYDSFSGLVKASSNKPEDVICFYEKMARIAVDSLLGFNK